MTRRIALIPLRGVLMGKTRLSAQFSPVQRARIVASMAHDVVGAAIASHAFSAIMVVSARTDVLYDIMGEFPGINVLEQPEHQTGLNPALDLGRSWARLQHATGLAVISADLPALQPSDVRALVGHGGGVVIASDRSETGTNGLYLGDPSIIERFTFNFGTGSQQLHLDEAKRVNARATVVSLTGFLNDLDTPEDWDRMTIRTREHLMQGIGEDEVNGRVTASVEVCQ